MFKALIITLCTLLLGAGAPATAPVPLGTTSAEVEDISYPLKLLSSCLAETDARASISIEILTDTDGDDQQSYRFVVESHAHEDAVDCLHAQVAAWGGVP